MRRRLVGEERERVCTRLKASYEKGASIRALMEWTGYSYGKVHHLLTDAGTTMRGRGGDTRSKSSRQQSGSGSAR